MLPLPYVVTADENGLLDAEAVQGNFDAIKKAHPFSRKDVKVESAHTVGGAGEPAFQNSWVNFDLTGWHGARFWKDPMGIVHLQGLIKNGTVGTTAFVLPTGYRPSNGLMFAVVSNNAFGRLDISPAGNVVPATGNNTHFAINVEFRQEQ